MNRKKVLIISYYWPPSGGIGVLRCLKIAKYLRQYGWEPVIFTAEGAHYPSIDHSNDKDVPPGATILRQRIWEPYHIYKFLTGQPPQANVNNVFYVQDDNPGFFHRLSVWIRSNFFIPDARALWIRPSVRFLRRYLKANPVDAIFSDGPPHSNTRIATLLKKHTGIPWLADFQDPWTQIDYYQLLNLTAWGDRRHHRMEQEAFRRADKITIVSPTWKKDLEAIGAENVSVIPWGYDPDDYNDISQEVGPKFTLTHLGIMGYDRNPAGLFRVLQRMCEEVEGFRENLELQLVGQVDYSVREAYEAAGLAGNVKLPGAVPRREALQLTMDSPILLLLLNQQPNAGGRIPGKLFEYLASRRPVLCLGPTDSDVAGILAETGGGTTAGYDDETAIRAILEELYQKFREGKLAKPVDSSIEKYSIEKLTGEVAGFLEEIAGGVR
ncbi:MAG: glycosyltransferase [Lewinellaceae bacterium]|nr:glycosyltransferase [Lewinellaceae bacterium]